MPLCKKLSLDKDVYSVFIPLGITINIDGAAITITIMTLAAANTLGMQVSMPAAILLSLMSALDACGASGVADGSLLLIPMACSLFGISNDIPMQVVGVGFIIGVIQDSVESALNSAGDVEFAATAEYITSGARPVVRCRISWSAKSKIHCNPQGKATCGFCLHFFRKIGFFAKKCLTLGYMSAIIVRVDRITGATEYADVAELADALDSGSSSLKRVWVQIPSSAPKKST